MKRSTIERLAILTATALGIAVAACSQNARSEGACEHAPGQEAGELARAEVAGEHPVSEQAAESTRAERGEHGEGGEHGEHAESGEHHGAGEEVEELGVYVKINETWDATRMGARLMLSFDAASDTFVGTVENTTQQTLCDVRVEVHLSTGTELGPTERTDLLPGERIDVRLETGGEVFETWTAHPEVSPCGG